ncbi:MAG: tyrosine-type recombinase/integrase [Ignavibacteria bacterium]|nr:tyrosine-type recombinase/integrase [Ignavibacteria bacterium]
MSSQGKLNLNYKPTEPETLSSLHERFIKHKQYAEGHSKITIEDYKYHFRMLLMFKTDMTLADLNEETLVNYLEYLNTRERKVGTKNIVRPYKNSTIATVRGKLSAFFNWLIERKYLSNNPFDKIAYPEVTYTDSRAFTPKEFESICHAVNSKIQWNNLVIKKRNIAIVMFLFHTGVRRNELVNIMLKDVDLDRRLIRINGETSKSKRTRLIPLNKELIPYLTDYLHYRKQFRTEYFWISGTLNGNFTRHGLKHFTKLLTKVTGINCHPHRFRHTFAVMYYQLTHDILGLMKLMGHKSLKMTLTYLRSVPDEHLIDQIERISINEYI